MWGCCVWALMWWCGYRNRVKSRIINYMRKNQFKISARMYSLSAFFCAFAMLTTLLNLLLYSSLFNIIIFIFERKSSSSSLSDRTIEMILLLYYTITSSRHSTRGWFSMKTFHNFKQHLNFSKKDKLLLKDWILFSSLLYNN